MREQLISAETAKVAKEKGFEYTQKIFVFSPNPVESHGSFSEKHGISQSLLQRWLREKHGFHINIDIHTSFGYNKNIAYYAIVKHIFNGTRQKIVFSNEHNSKKELFADWVKKAADSYEDALEKGLQESLKLIK